jgi:hypothetical protein
MKKRNVFLGTTLTVFLTIGLMLTGCGGGSKQIGLYVTADGSEYQSTTKLTFVFDEPFAGFTADKITLAATEWVPLSGVESLTKGELSALAENVYTLPISGFKQSRDLDVRVEGFEGNNLVYIYYVVLQDGIYIGFIKFAGDAESINLSGNNYYDWSVNPDGETNSYMPVLLDQSKYSIKDAIEQQYQIASQPGTAIYYAVHKALANLTSYQTRFPENTGSVYIITFTDGLDNGSGGQSRVSPIENKSFNDTPSYVTYVKNEIATRKINGKGITAYSIGVKGSDVQDSAGFTTSLQNIASPGKSKELTDYSSVQSTFDEIAEGLIQGSNFTLTTSLLDSGTKVRMTFDIDTVNPTPADASASTKYIEGTVTASGNNYTLTSISYAGGISSDAGTGPITGTVSGTTVNFVFTNITGYNFATDRPKTKQWLMPSGSSAWQINSEYSSIKSDFGSTVIYLVLDCSTSMTNDDISAIRTAVNSFIDKIYASRYEDGY